MDGSGYHRQLKEEQITMGQRVLAVADSYVTLAKQQGNFADPQDVLQEMEAYVGTRFDPDCYAGLVAYLQGGPGFSYQRASSGTRVTRTLSEREVEVLREVAKGLRNREIARSLVISEKTVERHLENIYNKLDVTSRTSAVVYAVQNGLVD
jgi:DNA-binding NarL/FixJ family response regulator